MQDEFTPFGDDEAQWAAEQASKKANFEIAERAKKEAEKQRKKVNKKEKLNILDQMNHEFALITRGNKVSILREIFDQGKDNRTISFLNKDAFSLLTDNRYVTLPGDEKPNKAGRVWLGWENRRQFEDVVFRPQAQGAARSYIGKAYNLWRGFAIEPDLRYVGAANLIFLDHLRHHVCRGNEQWSHWILSWMADLFQNPQRKPGTCLVLRGSRGSGKGIIGRTLGKMVGMHYMPIMHSSQVTGKFNAHLADKIFVFLDEALWAGDKSAEGPLKSIITEPMISVEMKGHDVHSIDSYLRVMMATNEDWAVPTGMRDERRFAVFDVQDDCVDEPEKRNAYFAAMEQQLKEGGYAGLMGYLLDYKYDPAILRTVPQTDALLEQKQLSLKPHEKWWHEVLHDGFFKMPDDPNREWHRQIKFDLFYKSYMDWMERMGQRYPLDRTQLTRKLKSVVHAHTEPRNGERFVFLQDLAGCREQFEIAIGQKMEWEK